ncbi:hypothetical protein IU483_25380 [Streptomyces gardneri]|nr:hypothetical protein [Streptomyces gardneri]
MPRMRRLGLVGAVLAMLIATGCGGSGSSGEVDKNAALRAAWTVGITTLDPHMQSSEIIADRFGLFSLYDRLFTVKKDGSLGPMLVRDWSYAPDGRSLSMTLREDACFADGTALDAEVVRANLERARTLDSPVVKGRMSVVEAIEVTGEYALTVRLKQDSSTLPYALAEISGMIMNPKLFQRGNPAVQADGTTPYRVESFTPGEKLVLVRARDDYWDPNAWQIGRIEHSQIADFNAMVNAVRGGQIDISQFQPNQVASLGNARKLQVIPVPTSQGFDIALNYDKAPLNDVRVRRAINYALDRKAIVDVFYPGSVAKYQYYREGMAGYDPQLENTYAYDPVKARALLADAGYPNGLEIGNVLVDTSTLPGVIDVVREQLGEVGITLRSEAVEVMRSFQRWPRGDDAARILSVAGGTSPVVGAQENWRTKTRNAAATTPEFERLFLAAARNTQTPGEAQAAARAVNRYVVEQAWRAPLVWQNAMWAVSDRIKGFSADIDFATTQGPYDWRYLTLTK